MKKSSKQQLFLNGTQVIWDPQITHPNNPSDFFKSICFLQDKINMYQQLVKNSWKQSFPGSCTQLRHLHVFLEYSPKLVATFPRTVPGGNSPEVVCNSFTYSLHCIISRIIWSSSKNYGKGNSQEDVHNSTVTPIPHVITSACCNSSRKVGRGNSQEVVYNCYTYSLYTLQDLLLTSFRVLPCQDPELSNYNP